METIFEKPRQFQKAFREDGYVTLIFHYLFFLFILTSCSNEYRNGEKQMAQWIGPELNTTDPNVNNLSNTNWIWINGRSNPAIKTGATPCYFRKSFELSPGKTIEKASISLTADDAFQLYINGKEIGQDGNWETVSVFDAKPFLKEGRNIIAVAAQNSSVYHTNRRGKGGNPAGLLLALDIQFTKGLTQTIETDSSWKVSFSKEGNWKENTYNDTAWDNAFVTNKKGLANWEGHDKRGNSWYRFRKKIAFSDKPKHAIANIAVDSKYWLWVNGKLALFEGGLKRGPNPTDTYYDEIDLSTYLDEGENTIAVLVWYWGRNSFSHKSSGTPGLFFELKTDGKNLNSDESWKISKHPAYGFSNAPHPNYRLAEYNIHYDAQKGNEEWLQPAFDDSNWEHATKYGAPPTAPWNNLVKRPIPQWKNSGLLDYEKLEKIDGNGKVDTLLAYLPTNAQITPYLNIQASAGQLIDIRMDNYIGGSEYNIRSEYITKDGEQAFEALAWMNGHVVKYAIPKGVVVHSVKYRETSFDAPVTGTFSCNNNFYNKLWQKSLRTLQVCMRDNYFDCPDRERAQWWGDAVIEIGQTFYTLDRVADSLTKKAIRELVDWKTADGRLYSPVPAGNWDSELPGQMLMSVGKYGFWNYFIHTGDTATIQYVYPTVKAYLKLWDLDQKGLLVHRTGDWDWGDWGSEKDRPLLDNCYYTLALQSAKEMATLLGHEKDHQFFQQRIDSIKQAFNAHFWNGNAYRSPGYQGETDDRGNGLAVISGIAGKDKFPAIKQVLQQQFYASPYTERYVLEALIMMGETDACLQRMSKRFEVMVNNSYATLLEGWGVGSKGYGGGTINHSWSGGPLIILSEKIAGISPIEPGYTMFKVMPNPGNLEKVSVKVPSIKGEIASSFENTKEKFELVVSVPKGTNCIAGVPFEGKTIPKKVSVNGKLVWEGEQGKTSLSEEAQISPLHLCFPLKEGQWLVKATY